MSKVIQTSLETYGVNIYIPKELILSVFRDNNDGQLKLKRKDETQFLDDFRASFKEKIEDDDFMNEVMEQYIYDADYIQEVRE